MAQKLLIAEDEEMDFYKTLFEEEGYEVIHAPDGEAALDGLMLHKPKVMLLDLRLPKVDGLEILKRMQERSLSPETRVIIWTGFDNYGEPQSTIEEHYGAQVAYYLKKPISLEDLTSKVRELMNGKPDEAA